MCAALILGILCARFRDIPQIVTTLVQMAFLLTPVIWREDMLSGRALLVPMLNPFRHYLDIARAPLLGETPSALSWGVVAVCTLIGVAVAAGLFARCRHRIAYWV